MLVGGWVGGEVLKGQREVRFACKRTLFMAAFLEIQNPQLLPKTCLCFPKEYKTGDVFFSSLLGWGKILFLMGTYHRVRHLPAVILTLFFQVRPHGKPSHPWQGKPRVFLGEKKLQFDFSWGDLWSPLLRQIKKEHVNELRISATYIENDTGRYLSTTTFLFNQASHTKPGRFLL